MQNINLYNHPKCFGFNKGLASSLILSSAISIHNFEEEKLLFDDALLSKDYNVLSGLIWTFEGESNFASVGYKAMPIDFDGNIIQDFNNPINGIRNIALALFIMTIFMIAYIDMKAVKRTAKAIDPNHSTKLFWDIFLTNLIFGFEPSNYAEYHFHGKPLKQRLTFLSFTEMILFSRSINLQAKIEVLDKKQNTYAYFKE